jgi:hypothetical protein
MRKSLFKADVLPALLAGVGRHPLPPIVTEQLFRASDPKPSLKALSLTGQALRFDRPPGPPQFAVEVVIEDDRTILPDELRRPLLRLITGKMATEHPSIAIARTFNDLRMRPHPFDLPRLDAFVRLHAGKLGATAQHWVNRQNKGADSVSYFDQEILNESNWTEAPLGRRSVYLQERRVEDPGAARALLEAAWPQESADARFRLLQTMQISLTEDDQPFLKTINIDRAPRVRLLAQRLLSRVDRAIQNPALQVCLDRIVSAQAGLLRKRPVLRLELPATVKEQASSQWIRETFSDVSFAELAARLALGEEEIIEAAANDANLLLALALVATADRRFDLFYAIINANLTNGWEALSESGLSDLGIMTSEERLRWVGILIGPYGHQLPSTYFAWNWLHRILDEPAPEALLDSVFRSSWLTELPTLQHQGTAWTEVLAALCPSSRRQALRERLNTIDTSLTSTAIALLNILDGMEQFAMERTRVNA